MYFGFVFWVDQIYIIIGSFVHELLKGEIVGTICKLAIARVFLLL